MYQELSTMTIRIQKCKILTSFFHIRWNLMLHRRRGCLRHLNGLLWPWSLTSRSSEGASEYSPYVSWDSSSHSWDMVFTSFDLNSLLWRLDLKNLIKWWKHKKAQHSKYLYPETKQENQAIWELCLQNLNVPDSLQEICKVQLCKPNITLYSSAVPVKKSSLIHFRLIENMRLSCEVTNTYNIHNIKAL